MDDWREHGEFLRRLARRLVSDHHAAEDVAQDAQLAALTSAPSDPERRRAWFIRVVHNLSLNLRRGTRRRTERERRAARQESTHDHVAARLELQGRIIALVSELKEPTRTTVYLRFYEDLPPREIARRQGVPVNTVKTRLQRALGHLRARLDREFGSNRQAWCAVLLPLTSAYRPLVPPVPTALLGGVAVKTAAVVGLAAIAVLLGILYLPSDPEPVSPPARRAQPEPETAVVDGVLATSGPGETVRQPIDSEPPGETAPDGDWILTGRVADSAGMPIAGAEIFAEMDPSRAGVATTSGDDGTYRLAVDLPAGISSWASVGISAEASAQGYGTAEQSAPNLRRTEERGQELVFDFTLAAERHARGTLVDVRGDAVSGAVVALIDENGKVHGTGRTEADGSFQFPSMVGEQVWMAGGSAAAGSVFTGPHKVPEGTDLDLGTIALQPHAVLEGTVALPDGSPLAGVRVEARLIEAESGVGTLLDQWFDEAQEAGAPPPRAFAGSANGWTHTDEQGRFRLEGLAPGSYELSLLGNRNDPDLRRGPFRTGERASIVLETYEVRVRVVDHQGLAVPGADVMVGNRDRWTVTSSRGLDADGTMRVKPGSWIVTASLEGARPVERPLEVTEGRFEYDVELVLDFEPATGELQVLVTDDRNQDIEVFRVNLWLQDSSATVADFSRLEPDSSGVLPPIPTGYYKVRVTFPTQPGRTLEPGREARLGDHFSVDAFATVVEGERATVRLTTHRGGRLRLWIEPDSDTSGFRMSLVDVLSGKERRLSALFFQTPSGGSGIAFPGLGTSGYTDLLAPGSYILRATAEGYEDFEQAIDVRPGEVTELRVVMQAR